MGTGSRGVHSRIHDRKWRRSGDEGLITMACKEKRKGSGHSKRRQLSCKVNMI